MQNQRNHPDDRWRAEARERQRLHRQRLRDGLHPVMLVLPDIVWAAWRVRERVPPTTPDNALPFPIFQQDLIDVLERWARTWLKSLRKK